MDAAWRVEQTLARRFRDPARWQLVPSSLTSVRTEFCAWSNWEAFAAEHRRNDAMWAAGAGGSCGW